jgi:light-regulated signal transduction histidine kinase (bacteriophytochrome)
VPWGEPPAATPAEAWRAIDGSVVVLVGSAERGRDGAPPWLPVVPLLAALLAAEHVARGERARADLAGRTMTELERVARELELERRRADRELAERREAQQSLLKRTVELERVVGELEQFTYITSHDLQEPLRMVTMYLGLVLRRTDDALDDTTRRYLGIVSDSAQRMQRLLLDLLDYTYADAAVDQSAPLSVATLVHEVWADLGAQVAASGGRIEVVGEETVVAEDSRLRLVLQNLISNALKFRGDRAPEVRVAVSDTGREWMIAVSDNGIGIPPDYHSKVFGVFQRLHGRKRFEGTGIGLATCKKLVERGGGRIWVEHARGPGTTIAFTLPKPGSGDASPSGLPDRS